tara:strand:- start:5005 stop:5577 length:573 start_codon:yes stop_codon:yes gene_type:complete
MKNSQDIINYLIKNNNYTRFLEIGVRPNNKGMSINQIECEHKDGVDTQPNRCNYTMTSDEFFNTIPSTQTYDIIFVDGCHEKDYVLRDVNNSLNHLNSNGIILCHDINPPSLMHLNPDLCWNAWEAWAELRCTRSDLQMYSLDIDMGPGIIVKGKQEIYKKEVLPTWEYLDLNRKELLNSIPVEKFTELF